MTADNDQPILSMTEVKVLLYIKLKKPTTLFMIAREAGVPITKVKGIVDKLVGLQLVSVDRPMRDAAEKMWT